MKKLIEKLLIVLKGFVMGIGNVIPGVSGGTLALTMGIYERLIESISHFFSKLKDNLKFLIPLGIGMLLSIVTMSNVVSYSFSHFAFPTTLLFMGLVIGGIPLLTKKLKHEKIKISNLIIFIITFSLVMLLTFSKELFGNGLGDVTLSFNFISLIKMFLVGIVAASTMIIPGVSGSLVLMLLGYYTPVIEAIKSLSHLENIGINGINLFVFGIGVILGIVVISKVIELLFKKHEIKTYYGVLGFVISSIIAIPVSVIHEYGVFTLSPIVIIIGILLLLLGGFAGYKLGER